MNIIPAPASKGAIASHVLYKVRLDLEQRKKVFKILTLANILAATTQHRWIFIGPHDNEKLTFVCILQNDKDAEPLTWANVELED